MTPSWPTPQAAGTRIWTRCAMPWPVPRVGFLVERETAAGALPRQIRRRAQRVSARLDQTPADKDRQKGSIPMTGKGFTISTTVPQAPMEVYRAIVDPRLWWGKDIEGITDRVGAEWTYRYQDLHVSRQRTSVLEPVGGSSGMWSRRTSPSSRTGTSGKAPPSSSISNRAARAPRSPSPCRAYAGVECYEICTKSWSNLVMDSLAKLLADGAGRPDEVLAPV